MTQECVGIVGAGPFGLALAELVARAGRRVLIWSQDTEVVADIQERRRSHRLAELELGRSVSATTSAHELAAAARFLVIAVSSENVVDRVRLLGEAVDGGHMAVHAIGALAPGDQRISELIARETPILRVGVLAGPALGHDLAQGRVGSMICASEFDEVTATGRLLLSVPPTLRLYQGRDVVGVELAAALAGAYTVALGVADALEVGIGTRAVLMTRAIAEMSRLGEAAGAEAKTFAGLAGLGNLLVRSSVESGRSSPSYRLGLALGRGEAIFPAEGARAALAGQRLAHRLRVRLPVLDGIASVLLGQHAVVDVVRKIIRQVAEEE